MAVVYWNRYFVGTFSPCVISCYCNKIKSAGTDSVAPVSTTLRDCCVWTWSLSAARIVSFPLLAWSKITLFFCRDVGFERPQVSDLLWCWYKVDLLFWLLFGSFHVGRLFSDIYYCEHCIGRVCVLTDCSTCICHFVKIMKTVTLERLCDSDLVSQARSWLLVNATSVP
jgi:hypothetical protein